MRTSLSIIAPVARIILTAVLALSMTSLCSAVDRIENADASPGGDGTSWSTPFKYLRDALAVAGADDVIRIKGATDESQIYYPDKYWNGSTTVDTNSVSDSFVIDGSVIEGDVLVLGQHTGNISDPDERDPDLRTILSGAISGSENSYHVLRIDGVTEETQVDGLEIASGDADGTGDNAFGGGILLGATDAASPLIRACTIRDNEAIELGGGAYFRDGSPTVRKSSFTNNIVGATDKVGAGGGGLFVQPTEDDPPSDLLLLAVRFEGNYAYASSNGRAGGVWIWEPTRHVDVIDCAFVGNVIEITSGNSGGGGGLTIRHAFECPTYTCSSSSPSCEPCAPPCDPEDVTFANVINSLFADNESRGGSGGGVKISRPTTFINCSIAGNISSDVATGGAGLWLDHGACAEFLNTIVHGNIISGTSSVSAFQKQIYQSEPDGEGEEPGPMTFERCDVEGISGTSHEICGSTWTSTCNIDADPRFMDAAGGNYRLSAGSPCRNKGVHQRARRPQRRR